MSDEVEYEEHPIGKEKPSKKPAGKKPPKRPEGDPDDEPLREDEW